MGPGRRNGKNQTHRAAVDAKNDSPKPCEFHPPSQAKNGFRSVEKKLAELRQQKGRLSAQKAEAGECWQNAQIRLQCVQAEMEGVSADILAAGQVRKLLERESEPTQTQKLRQELTELIAEQRIIAKVLGTVKRLKDKCPTCGQPVSAGNKASETEKQIGRLTEIERLAEGIRERLNRHTDLGVTESHLEDPPERSGSARRTAGATVEHSGGA